MIPETENRPSRPPGVTALGALLLLVCCSVLASAAAAIVKHADQVLTVPSILMLLFRWALPAAWVGATGVGLLKGKAWARGSYFTLCALAFIMTAGALSADIQTVQGRAIAGYLVAIFLCMAWGIWYLLGEKVKAWFK